MAYRIIIIILLEAVFIDWLGMMDLLNEEAIKELPEIKK